MSRIHEALQPFLRVYRCGLRRRLICDLLLAGLLLGAALVLGDALFSFGPGLRGVLLLFAAVGLLALAALRLQGMRALSPAFLARRLDGLRRDERHLLLTALQLAPEETGTPLARGLRAAAVERGAQAVERNSPERVYPSALVHGSYRRLLLGAAGVLLVTAVYGEVVEAVVPRYLHPWGDHPPYSPLAFEVAAADHAVPYGGTAELKAVVDGEAPAEIRLMLRGRGPARAVRCFVGAGGLRTQRVSNVVEPLTYWFETRNPWGFGRARSRRYRLSVIRSPEFTLLSGTVRPPAYTGRETTSEALGGQPLRAPQGSVLDLTAISNRPLRELRLERRSLLPEGEGFQTLRAPCGGRKSGRLRLPVQRGWLGRVFLVDIEGNESRAPREVRLECIPDRPPELSISAPEAAAVAMPRSVVPVRATARDEYGLARVRFVRALSGFRDRARAVPVTPALATVQEASLSFDLGALGVRPGETVEFFFEARDNNPYAPGFGSSSVHRLRVISEEEFLELVRMRTSIEEFRARQAEVGDALARLREAIREAEAVLDDPQATAAQKESARQAVRQARQAAVELLRQRAAGPHLYATEEEAAADLRRLAEALAGPSLPEDAEGFREGLASLARRAGEAAAEEGRRQAVSRRLAQAAKVLRRMQEYTQLALAQRELERRIRSQRDRLGEADTAARLETLAREQQALQQRLASFAEGLAKDVEALPAEGFDSLRSTATGFLEALRTLAPETDMDASVTACRAPDAAAATAAAQAAAAKLESLLGQCQGAEGAAQSDCLKFAPRRPDLAQTLRQLQMGFPLGSGGQGDGYAAGSNNAANLPMYGPPGLLAGQGTGRGRGAGRGGAGTPERTERTRRRRTDTGGEARERVEVEAFPEKYREAIGAYFGLEETDPAGAGPQLPQEGDAP